MPMTTAEIVQHLIDEGQHYAQQPGEDHATHRDRLRNFQDEQVFGLDPHSLARIGEDRQVGAGRIYEILARAMDVSLTRAKALVRDAVADGTLVREGESTATTYTTPAEIERREAARLAQHERNMVLAREAEALGLQVQLVADRGFSSTRASTADVREGERIHMVRINSSVAEVIRLIREARNGC